jgi:hypothetical protein
MVDIDDVEREGIDECLGFDTTADKIEDNPRMYVEHIDSFGNNLSDWEVGFIADLLDNPPEKYSVKQMKIIERIYDEKC